MSTRHASDHPFDPSPAGGPPTPASEPPPDSGAPHDPSPGMGGDAERIDGSLDLPVPADTPATAPPFPRNEVRLTGRISAIGEPVTLPSGDLVVNLRLVVPREHPLGRRPGAGRAATGTSPGVDTIDVACWTPATRRAAARVGVEGSAEVTGALRRRFFRAGGAPASRYEVEAHRIRRARPAS